MSDGQKTLSGLASAGAVTPRDFSSQPQRVVDVASLSLTLPPSLADACATVLEAGNFEPSAVHEAIVALCMGNLILAGPPGTGKTSLARALAATFNATLIVETANPEWSVYDTIGTQTLRAGGEAAPRHGLVTNAVLSCATAIVDELDSGTGPQAVWLLIDEMNRADIDRAFGPLFTALAGGSEASMVLDYMEGRPALALPARFRIIATVNEYDTRFVNSMSGALRRRFSKVGILPPPNEAEGLSSSAEWVAASQSALNRMALKVEVVPESAKLLVAAAETDLRRVLGFIRASSEGSIPVGTAQLIDVIEYLLTLAVLHAANSDNSYSWDRLDGALVSRLLPSLETDTTRSRLHQGYIAQLRLEFPQAPRFADRLEAFISGID